MNWFKNYRWKPVLAASVGLGVSSPAWGQLPPIPSPAVPAAPAVPDALSLQPAAPVMTLQPGVPPGQIPQPVAAGQPAAPAMTLQPGVPPGQFPQAVAVSQPGGPAGNPVDPSMQYPQQFGGRMTPGTPSVYYQVPGQTPSTPPLLSSQPPPFQVAPDRPAATNDPNFFNGFPQVQNAFDRLSAGNFGNTKYKWYGFVRVDSTYDFRPMGGTDSFVTSQIPVPQSRGQNYAINPRYTRLGFDTETPIDSMDWTLKTRIEMDFFNGNDSGSFGSFPLRLRFAWADFGPFLIGQAASLFMDYDVFPNVLDYQGPPGMVLMRQPLASVHFPVGEKLTVSMGVEQPYSDIQWLENGTWVVNPGSGVITTPGVGKNVQDVPDVTANVRYKGDYGHVQVAGILRKLTFQPGTGDSAYDDLGYGINLTGSFHPWACLTNTPTSGECATAMSKSRFLYQFAAGRGIDRYIQDTNGLGLDATYDPVNGFRTIPSYGWFVSYEQWWAKKWASVLTVSSTKSDLTDTLPGSTYQRAEYVSGNLIWLPVERMGVGLEFIYGKRENLDGQSGDNTRIQMGFQYKF